ncbi:hypothetical protein M3Y95_00492300 [Aphelenchoides besseyi]|nr:hypothetical protein M3Y95_00492300 [Aphelenchoides besseyi]
MSALEFYKYLLISRDFLRASQQYRVYQFAIFEYCSYDDKKFYVSAVGRKAVEAWATHFKLTLEEIRNWNRLLNVQYLYLYTYEYEHSKEFLDVSKIFTGHIALDLSEDEKNAKYHGGIIKQLQKQLNFLRCEIIASSIGSSSTQFNSCCRNYRKLLSTKKSAEKIDDNFFDDFPTSPSVEKLKFFWNDFHKDNNRISKITQLLPYFPNSNRLVIRAEHDTPEQFRLQQLVVWIREECKKIEKLQEACLPTTDITLDYFFEIYHQESAKIVNQLAFEILDTTKFNQWHSVYRIYPTSFIPTNPSDSKYYKLDFRWKLPNFCAILRFTVNVDALAFDDEASEDGRNEDEARKDDGTCEDDESTGDETTEEDDN